MRSRGGFTLLELLIVLVIIGILATLAIPTYQVMVYNARGAEAKANIGAIARAMAAFYAETGQLPGTYAGSYIPPEFGITIPPSKYWKYLYVTPDPNVVVGILAVPAKATEEEATALLIGGGTPYTNSEGAPSGAIVTYWIYFRWDTTTPPANEESGGLAFGKYYKFYKKRIFTGGTTVISKAGW